MLSERIILLEKSLVETLETEQRSEVPGEPTGGVLSATRSLQDYGRLPVIRPESETMATP